MKSKTELTVSNQRQVYLDQPPYEQFIELYKEAVHLQVPDANAMVVSTLSDNGWPSSRVVYLKDYRDGKLTFFTNYNSQKGKEILANPKLSLLFFWQPLGWQVRIQGEAQKSSRADSVAYFNSRERDKQLGAWTSPQSEIIESYSVLEERYQSYSAKYEGQAVECPEHWGGFDITPVYYEFWFGRQARLHERYCFEQTAQGWKSYMRAP